MYIGIKTELSLNEIAHEIQKCRLCILYKSRKNVVPGEGSDKARLMLIGEAPGSEEDNQGKPFIGRAGRILDEILKSNNLQRKDLFITSVVKCRPPNNRTPNVGEIKACLPYLKRQLDVIKPKIICLLGKVALQTFFEKQTIFKVRGRAVEKEGQIYFPTYHPAAALYNVRLKSLIDLDMREIKKLLGDSY